MKPGGCFLIRPMISLRLRRDELKSYLAHTEDDDRENDINQGLNENKN